MNRPLTLIFFFFLVSLVACSKEQQPANTNNANTLQVLMLGEKARTVEKKIRNDATISESDLEGLSSTELRILRNVNFARHGRKYERPGLGDYFYNQYWYTPREDYKDSDVTSNDRANVKLIQTVENRLPNSPAQPPQSSSPVASTTSISSTTIIMLAVGSVLLLALIAGSILALKRRQAISSNTNEVEAISSQAEYHSKPLSLYIQKNGSPYGPYAIEEVRHSISTGQLQPDDMAWYEGMQTWTPLIHIPEIRLTYGTIKDPGQKVADSVDLKNAGRLEEALNLLKEAVAESNDPKLRLFAASQIVTIISKICNGVPDVGTSTFNDLETYGQITLDSYYQVSPEVKQEYATYADIHTTRELLDVMRSIERGPDKELIGRIAQELLALTDSKGEKIKVYTVESGIKKHIKEFYYKKVSEFRGDDPKVVEEARKFSKRSDTHLLIVQNDMYYQLYIVMNEFEIADMKTQSFSGIFWLFITRPALLGVLLALIIGCTSCIRHVSDGTMMQALIGANWSMNFLVGALIGFAFGILRFVVASRRVQEIKQ